MTTTFDPKLSQYRVTQLVDLCRAREAGSAAPSQNGTVDSAGLCSSFQSLIHGHADSQVSSGDIPQTNALWRTPK